MIGAVLGLIGSAVSGFFGFKGKQAEVINSSIQVISDVNATSQARDVAAAKVIMTEAQSESGLTRSWRPMFMYVFMFLLISYWFGYYPPHLLEPMPPIVAEIFLLIKIGLGGYIPMRGIEKIVDKFKLGGILQKFIEKKLA